MELLERVQQKLVLELINILFTFVSHSKILNFFFLFRNTIIKKISGSLSQI
jgi:hypothetical protein